jgi:hypothetical protein
LSVHVSFGSCIVCPCFFWSLYCLSMFLLVVVLSVHVSFGRCIVCQCFLFPVSSACQHYQKWCYLIFISM